MSCESTSPIIKFTAGKRIVVLLGAGGVGKTTSAIAVAMLAASQGRRVALLSIDPAKRLAAALGIPLGNKLRRIALNDHSELGVISGSVDAAMLDQKAVFDTMVQRHAPSVAVAEKILAHPLYKAASTNLSGPLEYMALAKLQDLAEDPSYDLIVLDTPPDTHALDFLARPNVLAGFMDNKVMSWLIKPFLMAGKLGLGKLLSAGEKLMGGVAKVTGVSALRSFGDFLVLIQEVIEGFHKSGEKIVALLKSPETSFFLVTVPTRAASRSAENIALQLKNLGYGCDILIFNRCVPDAVALDYERLERAHSGAASPSLVILGRRLHGERSVMSELHATLTAQLLGQAAPAICRLADQDYDLNSLAAILRLAHALGSSCPA